MKHALQVIEGNKATRTADPVGSRIRAFLDGDNDGRELFAALYGHIAREPIPDRLRFAAGLSPDQERVAS
jgi:hypothetical protein